ncbi:MAG: c-type cytochrome domain-containing protein [Roseimicrobium sp.]
MKLLLALAALTLQVSAAMAADLDFYRDIEPFLKANCIACHNKTTTKAELNMETPDLMVKGGESGPALVPGKSAESLIVQASLHTKDMEMPPPNNKSGAVNLKPEEISLLKQWIDQGAKGSAPVERTVVWQPLAPGVHPIYSVALTRDGRYAACGRSNQIFIYDLATLQLVARLVDPLDKSGTAHRAQVQSLAFSADGSRLASGSFREVKLWRLELTQAAAGAADTLVKPVGEALLKQLTATSKVATVSHAASPDGKQIATGGADGVVRVWDSATTKLVTELRGSAALQKKIATLEWSIAALGLEQAFHRAEVARIEAQNKALDELLKKANEAIAAMKKALPEKQQAVKPTTEAKAVAQKAVDKVAAKSALAPGGQPDAALLKQLKDAQEKLLSAAMVETSALAAAAAVQSNTKDAEAEVKRITDAKAKNAKALAAANAAIDSAKGTHATATADLAAAKQAVTKAIAKPLAVAFSSDGQRVAALCDDDSLRVWAVATGLPLEEGNRNGTTTILSANPDGSFVASKSLTWTTGAAPRWVLERTLGGDKEHTLFSDRVNAVRFSPDGKILATGSGELSRSGDIHLFDVATGKAWKTWKERHADAVLSLDFSPDGKHLASGAADKIARITDVATGKQVSLFEGHTHHVMGVAYRSDGRVLATAGAEGVVLSWDLLMGERKKKIEGWTKEVTSLQFIGATNQIVTSAGDNRVRIVTDEGAEVRSFANLPDYMQSCVSTPTGSSIVAGGEDSCLRVWDGANGKELVVFGAN